MEFEQLNIDQQFIPEPVFNDYSFNTLDSSGKVYPLIDWATVMFSDCSIKHVLDWIHCYSILSEDLKELFETSVGYDNVFVLSFNGVRVQVSKFYFYDIVVDPDNSDLFLSKIVPIIRLDISGTGLNFLRSIGVDFNTHRFVVPDLPEGATYHFSRIDFAFDFINCFPNFVDQCLDFCNENVLCSGRIPIVNRGSGVSYRAAIGNQKTIYLGSSQSDKLLRIYDKRLEQINKQLGIYTKPNPYNNPDSWFRIEWQLRKGMAKDLSLRSISFEEVLKMIFDYYAFADGTVKYSRDRVPVDFWAKLMPWHQIKSMIIQNAKYVEFKDPERQLDDWAKRNIDKIMILIAERGIGYIDFLAAERCKSFSNPNNAALMQRFINKLIGLQCSNNLPTDSSSPGLFVSMGCFQWSNIGRFIK